MSWRSYKKILLSRKRVESLKRPKMHISLYSEKEPKDSIPSSYTAKSLFYLTNLNKKIDMPSGAPRSYLELTELPTNPQTV